MLYNKAYCLTLDKRYEDGLRIQKEGKLLGIDIKLFICGDGQNKNIIYDHIDIQEYPPRYLNSINYPTWYTRQNAYNAWLCHKKIMINVLKDDLEYLLMLEDDIIFESDFSEIIDKTRPFFNNNKWDMIYFGWYSNGHLSPTNNEHVFRMNGGAGLHGVLLTRNVIEQLIKFSPIGPFDWICGTYINPFYNCYAIYPSIITQKSGYSYIEGGNLEKPDRNHK